MNLLQEAKKRVDEKTFLSSKVIDLKTVDAYAVLEDLPPDEYQAVVEALRWFPNKKYRWKPKFWSFTNWSWQGLHALYAIAVFAPIVFIPHGVYISAFIFALMREYFQWRHFDLRVLMIDDRAVDIFGFLIGAAILDYFIN